MPELPEVEITRLGLLKHLKGRRCTGAVVRETRFRKPTQKDLNTLISGQTLLDIERRGKYLIWKFSNGSIFSHLGMSGTLTVLDPKTAHLRKHDHIDLIFGDRIARYHDPRRFGFLTWIGNTNPDSLPEISKLGVEPLTSDLTGPYLKESFKNSERSIKEALLDGTTVVGVGNIYCSESLFLAGINPKTKAGKISLERLNKLSDAIKTVLEKSLAEGGSTLKDFISAEGQQGYFTMHANVYGKEGENCPRCKGKIKRIIQNGRSTFYCPKCQK